MNWFKKPFRSSRATSANFLSLRIFSTPATIFKLSGSVGMALMLWVIAGIISTCGALVMLEFGSAIPRSGGIKLYLERSFSPKLLQICVYLFYCVFLRKSTTQSIITRRLHF